MDNQELDFELRQITPSDKLTGLSLGDAKFTPLKIFLQKNAKTFHEKSLAKTYAMFVKSSGKLVGYVTLVCGEIAVADDECKILPEDEVAYNYKHYPAVKIARLAVDVRYRGFNIGRTLIDTSLGIAKDQICVAVGCRFAVVDSKKESVDFYKKMGFTFLDTKANKERSEPVMFIDLHKISLPDSAASSQQNPD